MFSALVISPTPDRCRILKATALETNRLLLVRILEQYPQGLELVRLLNTTEPDLVLLDLLDPEKGIQCSREIWNWRKTTGIVGFDAAPSAHQADAGTRLSRILPFPPAPDALARSSDDCVQQLRCSVAKNLLAFLPAKAGSGATTVAWHTAVALAQTFGKKVLVIEGDLRSGVLSIMLNVRAQGTLQELLTDTPDGFRLNNAITRVRNVDVLLSDPRAPERPLEWEHCFRLVETACGAYDLVLADLPELISPPMRQIVRRASRIFIVCTPEIVALELARLRCEELLEWGVPGERTEAVLNHWFKGEIGAKDVGIFLGRPVQVLPNDPRATRTAVLQSACLNPESELSRAIVEFAARLGGAEPPAAPPPSLSGSLRQLLRRG